MEMITIPKKEYLRLKRLERDTDADWELVESFERGLDDLKNGRVERIA